MKELTKEEFVAELTCDRPTDDVEMGIEGMDNEAFYRSDNAKLFGILIHDTRDDDWAYILFYRMRGHGAVNYDSEAGMDKGEALSKLIERLGAMDRKPFGVVVGASVAALGGKYFAVIHGVTPIGTEAMKLIGIIPKGCVLATTGPFDQMDEAKAAGTEWLDKYHRDHPDDSFRLLKQK